MPKSGEYRRAPTCVMEEVVGNGVVKVRGLALWENAGLVRVLTVYREGERH